jgi:hypothetical protein
MAGSGLARRFVSGRLTQVAAVAALAAAGLAGVVAAGPAASASPVAGKAPAATAPTWRMQAPPEPAGTIQQAFGAVSCSSASACLALAGNAYPNSTDLGTFAETWNGSHWTVRKVPHGRNDANLSDVKCRSAKWCMAVGEIQAVPPIDGNYVPITDRWNGRAWTQSKPPVPASTTTSSLTSVACSGTRACTAIGEYAKNSHAPGLLAERWNGSAWRVQPVPGPSGGGALLQAVACPAARVCRAVGFDNKGLFSEVWNGSSWKVRPVPVPAGTIGSTAGLRDVSCTAADSCEAVGGYQKGATFRPLAEVWNGSRWRVQAPPTISGGLDSQLYAVSCVSATDCEASGGADTEPGTNVGEVGVLEKWNGTGWSVQKKVLPAGAQSALLGGISCTTGPVCEATGWQEKAVPDSHLMAWRYSS